MMEQKNKKKLKRDSLITHNRYKTAMKNLILLIVSLFISGCYGTYYGLSGNINTHENGEANLQKSLTPSGLVEANYEARKLKLKPRLITEEERSVAGTYARKTGEHTFRMVLLKNGMLEGYKNGKKIEEEARWKLVGGEIHFISSGGEAGISRINPDGSITDIARIDKDGKRKNLPEEDHITVEKIKFAPRQITDKERSVVGTYEEKRGEDTYRAVFLDNGIAESYDNGKKDEREAKWKLTKGGEIHVTMTHQFSIGVLRINKDGSITGIAMIYKNGERKDIPKEDQKTYKKIK